MTQSANLAPDAFAGTAEAYARYRPPYPRALLNDLLARARLAPTARLLDLACGPGRLALDLAGRFDAVLAVDLEPEMVEVGRREAARRGIANVEWRQGRAEDLDLPSAAFDLIVIGEAFHRLEQAPVSRKALGWLRPGGCIALPGCDGVLGGREAWQRAVTQVARQWMARAFPGGVAPSRSGAAPGPENDEQVLRDAGFEAVASHAFAEPHAWTFEAVAGYLRSTSVCSGKALGDDAGRFDSEIKAALAPYGAVYRENLRFGYTFGRKPG
ncbi:MAG: class I SAM-dependent methyltransferase [Caulobacteraceae bacterium]